MKKTTASREGGGGSEDTIRSGASALPVPFTLINLTRVEYGTKLAVGKIEIAGLGAIGFEYFKLADGRSFVEAESIRNKYGGRFERTVIFDDDFASELLLAVESRLVAE